MVRYKDWLSYVICFFFFNDTATTEIYTLSLHDALPISAHYSATWLRHRMRRPTSCRSPPRVRAHGSCGPDGPGADRKSTRLNSSHANISYAVFCLKKKKSLSTTQPIIMFASHVLAVVTP